MSMSYLGFGCDTQLSDNLLYETPLRQADQQYYHRSGSQELQQITVISRLLLSIIPPLRHFTILGQKNEQNMPRYYIVEQGKNTD